MSDKLYRIGKDGPVVRVAGESPYKGKARCVVVQRGAAKYCYQHWGIGTILVPHPEMTALTPMEDTDATS